MLDQPNMRGNGLPWFKVSRKRVYNFPKEMLNLSFRADGIVHVRGRGIWDLESLCSFLSPTRDSASAITVPSMVLQH